MARELTITVDTPTCTGCRVCEMVCSLFHEKVTNIEKARLRITDRWDDSLFEPHICQLCDDAPCVAACPTSALSQDERGVVKVDQDACNGCAACMSACQYDAIYYQDEFQRLFVCDRCDGDPTCVKFCFTKSLILGKPEAQPATGVEAEQKEWTKRFAH